LHLCLDTVLHEQGTEINLEGFGRVLNWFGDFDDSLTRRIHDLLKQDWYHGPIDRESSEFALRTYGKKQGFLVRNAPIVNTPFTISYLKSTKKGGSFVHQRVFRTVNGFSYSVRIKNQLETLEASSLAELVEKLLKEKKI